MHNDISLSKSRRSSFTFSYMQRREHLKLQYFSLEALNEIGTISDAETEVSIRIPRMAPGGTVDTEGHQEQTRLLD